jgi:hypothetical protein
MHKPSHDYFPSFVLTRVNHAHLILSPTILSHTFHCDILMPAIFGARKPAYPSLLSLFSPNIMQPPPQCAKLRQGALTKYHTAAVCGEIVPRCAHMSSGKKMYRAVCTNSLHYFSLSVSSLSTRRQIAHTTNCDGSEKPNSAGREPNRSSETIKLTLQHRHHLIPLTKFILCQRFLNPFSSESPHTIRNCLPHSHETREKKTEWHGNESKTLRARFLHIPENNTLVAAQASATHLTYLSSS